MSNCAKAWPPRAARRALDGAGGDAAALDTALALADKVLAVDAAVEEAHRVRMEVFFRRDDRASAIEAWDGCRHALRTAYGIAPSAATNELGRRILVGEPAGPLAKTSPSAAASALPLAIPPAFQRPGQLVGRGALLTDLSAALARGQAVLLVGPGGMGKSRVLAAALRAAGGRAPAGGPRLALVEGGDRALRARARRRPARRHPAPDAR